MISKNISSRNNPFLLCPIGKDYLWGGTRLNDDFSKEIDMKPLAETWECAAHKDGVNVIGTGVFKGRLLDDVLKEHPDLLGTKNEDKNTLPILVKLIDAKSDLSVQVHPDNEYARMYEDNSLGKAEMWYILDAENDSSIIYGFNRDIDKDKLLGELENVESRKQIEKYLNRVRVEKNDVYFIKPGIVHAIGKGVLLAEIQQNSNITYRLYDYERTDKNGEKRELHIKKALDVVETEKMKIPRQPMRVLKYKQGYAEELLCSCEYFKIERILINTEQCRQMTRFSERLETFQVLLCISGCGVIISEGGEIINVFKGDCIFVPAGDITVKMHGKMKFLKVSC